MTEDKKFKRVIRRRMHATGETYTQAREALLAATSTEGRNGPLAAEPPIASGVGGTSEREDRPMETQSDRVTSDEGSTRGARPTSTEETEKTFRVWFVDGDVLDVRAASFSTLPDPHFPRIVFFAGGEEVAAFREHFVTRVAMADRVTRVDGSGR